MPFLNSLNLKSIDITDTVLEKIKNYHGMNMEELIEELDEVAKERLQELYNEARE